MTIADLPEITEIKRTLAGVEKTFHCRLIARRPGEAVVLFVSHAPVRIHEVALPAGTITFGYFWEKRDYNVYHWMAPHGSTIAFYINLADQTHIESETLVWRDLALDILVPPAAEAIVLDEHELPTVLDPRTRRRIQASKEELLADAPDLRIEIEAASDRHWPTVFGKARSR
jgi:Protein of unknown function (DUF402)